MTVHLKAEYAIVVFSGFLQKMQDSQNSSGMIAVAEDIYSLTYCFDNVRTFVFPWKAPIGDIAETIWRKRPSNPEVAQKYIVIGYSYGGQAAVNFCHEVCLRSQTDILELALCDPVVRWSMLPGVAAASGFGKLRIPNEVQKVWAYVQKNPRWKFRWPPFEPAGHTILWRCKKINPVTVNPRHTQIDNDSGFRLAVRGMVQRHVCNKLDNRTC